MTDEWRDLIVGDRMAVDQQFADRVADSEFSSQQWGLIMTAVEFEIDQPGDPDAAELVADTTKLPSVLPELDAIEDQTVMGRPSQDESSDSGLLESVTDALGLGADDTEIDQQRLDAAETLTQEYATALQRHLEDTGKWDQVLTLAAQ